jgi:hypothetical protein
VEFPLSDIVKVDSWDKKSGFSINKIRGFGSKVTFKGDKMEGKETNLIYYLRYLPLDLHYVGVTRNKSGLFTRIGQHYVAGVNELNEKGALAINSRGILDIIMALTQPADWSLEIIEKN